MSKHFEPDKWEKPNLALVEDFTKISSIEEIRKYTAEWDLKYRGVSLCKDLLETLNEIKSDDEFRTAIVSISMRMSSLGVAPFWQALHEYCDTEIRRKALEKDKAIIDLFWLSNTFPNHKTAVARWNPLFTEFKLLTEFNLGLAQSIAIVSETQRVKIKRLNISEFQQFGCSLFATNHVRDIREAAKRSSVRAKVKLYANQCQKTEKDVEEHIRRVILCAKMANCSQTKTAKMYKWVSGLEVKRQSVSRTIKAQNILPFKTKKSTP